MDQKKIIEFKIEHIDPMGQGVSKLSDKILFVPKTLSGETGTAEIKEEQQKVQFGEIVKLMTTSIERIEPACVHFVQCPACDFQHTSYEHELKLKQQSLSWLLKSLVSSEIHVHPAPDRFYYRNRIQIHYNTETKEFGLIKRGEKNLLPIPQCLIANPIILKILKEWTDQHQWMNFLPKNSPPKGHVEFYLKKTQLLIHWNQPYATGGFTQVNQEMNKVLKNIIQEKLIQKDQTILDLFGGAGNLSEHLPNKKRFIVDAFPSPVSNFYQVNLNLKNSIKTFKRLIPQTNFETILIDPPRTGFYHIQEYLEYLSFNQLVLVSCFPATLKRDLERIKHLIEIESVHLVDLFPATQHYETVIFARRKNLQSSSKI